MKRSLALTRLKVVLIIALVVLSGVVGVVASMSIAPAPRSETQTETKTVTQSVTNTETLSLIRTETRVQTVTQTVTTTETRPVTRTETQTRTVTQNVTNTETRSVTRNVTELVTVTKTQVSTKTVVKTVTRTLNQTQGGDEEITPQEELVPVTFILDAPDVGEVSIGFPVFFWTANRMEDVQMENQGGIFKATVELPKNSLIEYSYLPDSEGYEGGERLSRDDGVTRMVYVTQPLTLQDEIYPRLTETVSRPIRLHGRVTDKDTGQPVVEAVIVAEGVITFATGDGSYELDVRPGTHLVIVFLLDGSYKTQSRFVQLPGEEETDFELEKAKPVRVRVNIDANPPPFHKVRIYSTAEQTGPRFLMYNGFRSDNYIEIDGSTLELDLYEGQYVDYLYTVGNQIIGYENSGGRHVIRHLIAEEGLVINDRIGTLIYENPITLTVKVADYTYPNDIIGVGGFFPPALFMHPKGNDEWVISLPDYLLGSEYFYYKSFTGEGREKPVTRRLNSTEMNDVVEAWYYQSSEVASSFFSALEIRNRFDIFLFPPDLYSPEIAQFIDRGVARGSEKGFHGIVLSQIWGYESLERNPKLSRALYTPLFELKRVASMAQSRGLKVSLYPQLIGGEDILHTGVVLEDEWWDQFLDELEKFNLYNARTAQAAGIDYLMVQGRQPGFLMKESYRPIFNDRMKEILVKMSTVYDGKIIAQSDWVGEIDYWHDADIVSQKVLDPLDLADDAPQEEVDRMIANHLDSNYKWISDKSGKPFLIDQFNAGGILLPLEPDPERENPATKEDLDAYWQKQVRWHEAVFRAINERDWIIGVYLFPYGLTDAPESIDASIRGKPAEELSSAWARKISESRQESPTSLTIPSGGTNITLSSISTLKVSDFYGIPPFGTLSPTSHYVFLRSQVRPSIFQIIFGRFRAKIA